MNNTKFHKSDELVQNVFNSVFDNYDLMNDIMSFGIHRLWKKDLIYWLSPQKKTNLIDNRKINGNRGEAKIIFSFGKSLWIENPITKEKGFYTNKNFNF